MGRSNVTQFRNLYTQPATSLWLTGFKIHSEALTLSLESEFAACPQSEVDIITRLYAIRTWYFTPGRRTRQCKRAYSSGMQCVHICTNYVQKIRSHGGNSALFHKHTHTLQARHVCMFKSVFEFVVSGRKLNFFGGYVTQRVLCRVDKLE